MILLWGALYDNPFAEVFNELQARNAPLVLIEQAGILDSKIELDLSCPIKAEIKYKDILFDSETLQSAYIRTYDLRDEENFNFTDMDDPSFKDAMKFEEGMGIMLNNHSGRIVNPFSKCASNTSKPYQMDIIESHGFAVPKTIITSSPEFAKAFLKTEKKIIYKSISSCRSIVSCITENEIARLDDIVWCPTQFQSYIDGDDYRVHVLGEKIFTTKITSSQGDYRYSNDTQLTNYKLPVSVEEKCFELTKFLGLHFSGIDLRNNGNDAWYCFEVNPSPGYTYFSNATGQRITSELADFLMYLN